MRISNFTERPGAKDMIEATIVVESPSQRSIILGGQGRAIKQLGMAAREDIERFLGADAPFPASPHRALSCADSMESDRHAILVLILPIMPTLYASPCG